MLFEFIIGYYVFTFQQYVLHRFQHVYKKYKTHVLQHHGSYDRRDITLVLKENSLYQNTDLYLYGNIGCIMINYQYFDIYVLLFQLYIGYLSYYIHNQFHTTCCKYSYKCSCKYIYLHHNPFFTKLQYLHTIHHMKPNKNYFIVDPTFDILFGTFCSSI